jgi:hypothetical protein
MKISTQYLKDLDACEDQVELWSATFGDEPVKLTLKKAKKFGHLFDTNWAAETLLTHRQKAIYISVAEPAWAAYEAEMIPVREIYDAATRPATEAHEKASQAIWQVYREAIEKMDPEEAIKSPFERYKQTLLKEDARAARETAIRPLVESILKIKAPARRLFNEAHKPLLQNYQTQCAIAFIKASKS